MLAYVGLEIGLVLQNDEFLCGLAYMCGLAERCGLAEWVVLETSCGFPDGCGLAVWFVFCRNIWACRLVLACVVLQKSLCLQTGEGLCEFAE